MFPNRSRPRRAKWVNSTPLRSRCFLIALGLGERSGSTRTPLRSRCFLMPSGSVARKFCSTFLLRGVNKKSPSISTPPAAGSTLDARAELKNPEARLNLRFRNSFIVFPTFAGLSRVCMCSGHFKKNLNALKTF